MGVVRKTISLSEEQDAWVKQKVSSGEFSNDSEVLRALVKHQQKQETKREQLFDMIQAGIDSGTSDRTFDEIVAAGRKRAEKVLAEREKGAA